MPHDGEDQAPLMQPRLVRALKNRPRLLDDNFRQELLEQLEMQMIERRKTDTVAHRISHGVAESVKQTGEPVVRNRVKSRMDKANKTVLEKL